MLIFLQAPFLKRLLDFLLVLLSTQTPPISSVLVSPPHYSKQSRIPPLVHSQPQKLQPQNLDKRSFVSTNVRILRQLPVHFNF